MPMRDWGLGLEELTEYYHRYGLYYTDYGLNNPSQHWFITRGVIDQSPRYSRHKKINKDKVSWSPTEIDLVGFRINHKCEILEVRLIQCKEHVAPSMVEHIASNLMMPKMAGIMWEAEKRKILTKYVSYVTISLLAKKKLEENGIKLLSFETMVQKLLQLTITQERLKRKGFTREQPLWLLRSLKDHGFFDKKIISKLENQLNEKPR